MSAIQETIKAAQAAASQIIDARVLSETLHATTGMLGREMVLNYSKPSLATLGSTSGIVGKVSTWLKVDEFGMSIGSDKKKFDKLLFTIEMVEDKGFYVKESIKWGNPVQYASRYNGPLSDKGEPWAEVVMRARESSPGAKVYSSADIILTSVDKIELKDKITTLPEGTKLGLTLSMSNWRSFEDFCMDVRLSGQFGTTVTVVLTPEEVTSKAGQNYGVFNFRLIE